MANLIRNMNGKKAYVGILSPEEIKDAEKLMESLLQAIPVLEDELERSYGNSIKRNRLEYAHEYGRKLRELLEMHSVKKYQKIIFFEQIRYFASQDENLPKDRSESRGILNYYYKLANYPLEEAKLINWSEWSQLFDIPALTKDERIVDWLIFKSKEAKIPRELFRELMTGIRLFSKNKDLSVFTQEQLFNKLNQIYTVTFNKLNLYEKYFTSRQLEPTKARMTQKQKYREKYFNDVLKTLKINKDLTLEEVCEEIFVNVYNAPAL
ncbi:hypothetical protein [Peribacillus sp. TH14]|uniref:hypothetical protein n=1 Tax=Peribacillus sp. TH14 TaxID=2798481 RepID=UPI0019126C68|nr:hypothetical protein [Peribacillus sp. TH14]MBK5500163.1 hypothetical protein [Peribacillus sp. TH14]